MASDFKVNGITPSFGNIKVGNNNVSKIYQGPTQVWPAVQAVRPVSDLNFLPYTFAYYNLEQAQAIWATQNLNNLQNPQAGAFSSVTGAFFTVPTTLNGSTQNDACSGQPQYNATNYGNQFQTSQTQGAFFIEVELTIYATQSGQGLAGGIVVQRRADSTQNWTAATNMSGITMNNNTNHGYQTQSSPQPLGLYKSSGVCQTIPGGSGGCGALNVISNFATQMTVYRYFCFDEVGEYRIILGKWQSAGGSCFNYQNNFSYEVSLNIDSLYDGSNAGYPYHVSSGSNTSTVVNAYAAEMLPMAAKKFYTDQALTTPLANSAGAKYVKRINTLGAQNSIINYEESQNGQYEMGIDNQGDVITQIVPDYM